MRDKYKSLRRSVQREETFCESGSGQVRPRNHCPKCSHHCARFDSHGLAQGNARRETGGTVLAAFLSLFVLVPLSWAFLSALKSTQDLASNPLGLPQAWLWDNFIIAWERGRFGTYFVNSVIVAVPTVLLVLALSTLAAYGFSQFKFRANSILLSIFLLGLTIPLSILVIPLFYDLLAFKLINTYWALIFPQVAKTLPFGIVLLKSFMDDFPEEILDAARMDGCSRFRILISIIVPLYTALNVRIKARWIA